MARSRMLWAPLALLAALTHIASADIEFTSPKAGVKIAGGNAIVVEWKDSGDSPAISDLTTYQLFICAGGNDPTVAHIEYPFNPTAAEFERTGNKAEGTIGKEFGASKPDNAYYLKIISTAAKGGTVTNFSPRFTLSGMTGNFAPDVIAAMADISGTDGPARIDATADGAAPADPADGDYGVDYTMQTGPTRYAPMQPVPPTKITKKNAGPLHPTSGFTIAKEFMPTPKVQTTITQSQTFSVSSRENTVAPAALPSDDMQKFLNRWKD